MGKSNFVTHRNRFFLIGFILQVNGVWILIILLISGVAK